MLGFDNPITDQLKESLCVFYPTKRRNITSGTRIRLPTLRPSLCEDVPFYVAMLKSLLLCDLPACLLNNICSLDGENMRLQNWVLKTFMARQNLIMQRVDVGNVALGWMDG